MTKLQSCRSARAISELRAVSTVSTDAQSQAAFSMCTAGKTRTADAFRPNAMFPPTNPEQIDQTTVPVRRACGSGPCRPSLAQAERSELAAADRVCRGPRLRTGSPRRERKARLCHRSLDAPESRSSCILTRQLGRRPHVLSNRRYRSLAAAREIVRYCLVSVRVKRRWTGAAPEPVTASTGWQAMCPIRRSGFGQIARPFSPTLQVGGPRNDVAECLQPRLRPRPRPRPTSPCGEGPRLASRGPSWTCDGAETQLGARPSRAPGKTAGREYGNLAGW